MNLFASCKKKKKRYDVEIDKSHDPMKYGVKKLILTRGVKRETLSES